MSGIVHEQTNMLNDVRNVRSGNSEALEGSHEASVDCQIIYRRPNGTTEFGARVCRSGEGLACGHTGLVDDLSGIFPSERNIPDEVRVTAIPRK